MLTLQIYEHEMRCLSIYRYVLWFLSTAIVVFSIQIYICFVKKLIPKNSFVFLFLVILMVLYFLFNDQLFMIQNNCHETVINCMLILNLATWWNSLALLFFPPGFLKISYVDNQRICTQGQISFLIIYVFYFLFLPYCRTSHVTISKSGKNRHPCLVLDIRRKHNVSKH